LIVALTVNHEQISIVDLRVVNTIRGSAAAA